jgi:Uma2 family endonuclease
MTTLIAPLSHGKIVYPESDGLPMADNTLQFQYITMIENGLEALFADRADVFVAGDLLWYPTERHPEIRVAPDVLVVFGRPKGHRGSYRQWEEGGIAPQVVFEILSPGNTLREMARKFDFYEQHGVEEYYVYAPERQDWSAWTRADGQLRPVPTDDGWLSPRLGVRFELDPAEGLLLYRPDGERFKTFVAMMRERNQAQADRDAERERAERLATRLRELGIDPDGV